MSSAETSYQEENWYKPQPGEPYRPLIALPRQIKEIDPWCQNCTDLFSTAFDPPHTLVPATAMVPEPTTSQLIDPPMMPTPSPALDVGPQKTSEIKATSELNLMETSTIKTADPGFTTLSSPELHGIDPLSTSSTLIPQSSTSDGLTISSLVDPTSHASIVENAKSSSSGPAPQEKNSYATSLESQSAISFDQDYDNRVPSSQSETISTIDSSAASQETVGPQMQSTQGPNAASVTGEQGNRQTQSLVASWSTFDSSSILSHSDVSTEHSINLDNSGSAATAIILGSHRNSITDGYQIVQLSAPPTAPITTIDGHTIAAVPDGASVYGTTISAGATPVSIQGTPISIDSSHRVFLGGKSYQLPTTSRTPLTLADNGVALPIQDEISLHGTTIAPGGLAMTVSGAVISLDDSSNLDLFEDAMSDPPTPMFLTLSHSGPGQDMLVSGTSQTTAAASATAPAALTPSASVGPATINGTATSLESTGAVVMISETAAIEGHNADLGSLIMGGLQFRGPSPTNSTSVGQSHPFTAPGTPSNTGPMSKSSAKSMDSLLIWHLGAMLLAVSATYVHI